MNERVDTIIVGGGQAGLSMSYHLMQKGHEHVILDQAERAASAWRNRWDSFTLITPNWSVQLPGAVYQGNVPDNFMGRDELVAFFDEYVERYHFPIRYRVQVTSVEPNGDGYLVSTNKGEFEAANVVIATGLFQQPRIPSFGANLPTEITQRHSHTYRNPEALPNGAVLVVGSAQSGCQIAEELYQSGRKVYLSVSSSGRFPRRYRSKDFVKWMVETGFADQTVDNLPSPQAKFAASAHGTGKNGGHTINLHQFARDGVVLLGRVKDIQGESITLAQDLTENLAKGDKFEAEMVKMVDSYIEKSGLELPTETLPTLLDGYEVDEIHELDLKSAGITSVVWATGFKFDFSLVRLPVFDADGYPEQQRGVTTYPGLYFIGLPFLHTLKSALLSGVGEDAAYLASKITATVKV